MLIHFCQVATPFALALAIVRPALHKALKKHPVELVWGLDVAEKKRISGGMIS